MKMNPTLQTTFQRGQDPKDAMDIGDKRTRKMSSVGMRAEDIEKMSHVNFC